VPSRLLAALLALTAACGSSGTGAARDDDAENGGDLPSDVAPCEEAADCVLAASTCCECPTFAVATTDGYGDGCALVECPAPDPSGACPALEAACEDQACAVRCAEVAATRTCAGGFARDALGCLLDACAEAPAARCEDDDDCVQVPADCCGCARGGADTAVLADAADAHADGLACTGDEVCPRVDVCDAGEVPTCVAGACALLGAPSEDDEATAYCGTPDHPSCPEGSACVLNADDPVAAALGVGVCRPST
jgi:hypothetical protein